MTYTGFRLLSISSLLMLLAVYPLMANSQSISLQTTPDWPQIRDTNWLNQNFLSKQRKLADDLAREHLGQRVRTAEKGENTLANLETIQRLINEEKIPGDDKNAWQAIGVVIGDIYVDQMEELQWKVYEDEEGNSHAVCFKGTKECIFPITMVSRRVKVGLKPDVSKIFYRTLDDMKTLRPKLPYSFEPKS